MNALEELNKMLDFVDKYIKDPEQRHGLKEFIIEEKKKIEILLSQKKEQLKSYPFTFLLTNPKNN